MNSPDCLDLYTDKHKRTMIERRELGSNNELDWTACCHTNRGVEAAQEIVDVFNDMKGRDTEYRVKLGESGL